MGSNLSTLIKNVLIIIIGAYQRTLSPDHGWFRHNHPYGFCKYYPTCSEYAIHAIRRYGVVRGTAAAALRVMRCTPWSRGGLDLIH